MDGLGGAGSGGPASNPTSPTGRSGPQAYATGSSTQPTGALKQVSERNIVIGGMTWSGGDVRPADFMRFLRLPSGTPPAPRLVRAQPVPVPLPQPPRQAGRRRLPRHQRPRHARAGAALRFGRTVPLWLSEFTIQSDQRVERLRAVREPRPSRRAGSSAAYRARRQPPVSRGAGLACARGPGGRGGSREVGPDRLAGEREARLRRLPAGAGTAVQARGRQAQADPARDTPGLADRGEDPGRATDPAPRPTRATGAVGRAARQSGPLKRARLMTRGLRAGSYTSWCSLRAGSG